MKRGFAAALIVLTTASAFSAPAAAQIGRRFPSEKKIVADPITGVSLSFLTSHPPAIRRSIPLIRNGPRMVSGSSSARIVQPVRCSR